MSLTSVSIGRHGDRDATKIAHVCVTRWHERKDYGDLSDLRNSGRGNGLHPIILTPSQNILLNHFIYMVMSRTVDSGTPFEMSWLQKKPRLFGEMNRSDMERTPWDSAGNTHREGVRQEHGKRLPGKRTPLEKRQQ
jgi:hypothetical protein